MAAVGVQDEGGDPHLDAAVHAGMAAADRAEPAGGHREGGVGLQLQVVVPLSAVADVQRLPVHAGGHLDGMERAHPGERVEPGREGAGAHGGAALEVEPRAVQHQADDAPGATLASPPVEPEGGDEPAGGVRHHEERLLGVLQGDDLDGTVELEVVLAQVRGVVAVLLGHPGPAALAQVQGIEGEAPGGEEVGQLGLEEVVREAVHVQHGSPHVLARPGDAPHQHRAHVALTVRVGAELEDRLLVALAEDVGLPLDRGAHARAPDPEPTSWSVAAAPAALVATSPREAPSAASGPDGVAPDPASANLRCSSTTAARRRVLTSWK